MSVCLINRRPGRRFSLSLQLARMYTLCENRDAHISGCAEQYPLHQLIKLMGVCPQQRKQSLCANEHGGGDALAVSRAASWCSTSMCVDSGRA